MEQRCPAVGVWVVFFLAGGIFDEHANLPAGLFSDFRSGEGCADALAVAFGCGIAGRRYFPVRDWRGVLGRYAYGCRGLSPCWRCAVELGPIDVCVWRLLCGDGVRLDVAGG